MKLHGQHGFGTVNPGVSFDISRPQTCGQSAAASWPDLLCQGNAPALLVQKCLLYWYKSTVADMLHAFVKEGDTFSRLAGTQFTCFTGAKVQILTD